VEIIPVVKKRKTGMHSVGGNNPCGEKEKDRDASDRVEIIPVLQKSQKEMPSFVADLFYKRKDTGANVEMVVYNGMENDYLNADGGKTEMINELHLAMIELYQGDAKRIQHFCKVHSYAKLIAETEHVDERCLFILEAAALTHDIGIHLCEEKYGDCNGKLQEKEGPAIAAELLAKLGFDQAVSDRVQYLIAHHHTYDHIDGMDYQILVEADFLVNIMGSEMSKEAAEKAYHNIFRTECGKTICREMFDI